MTLNSFPELLNSGTPSLSLTRHIGDITLGLSKYSVWLYLLCAHTILQVCAKGVLIHTSQISTMETSRHNCINLALYCIYCEK